MQTLPETTKLTRAGIIARVTAIAEETAAPAGIEIVEVELKGSGERQLLRVFIDTPEGVTLSECELVHRALIGAIDAEIQVSSPGVERRLTKWQEWVRFCGKKAKVVLKEPMQPAQDTNSAKRTRAEVKSFDGLILRAENHTVTMELAGGATVTFPIENVDRANLRFEW